MTPIAEVTHHDVVQNIRLHALLWAICLPVHSPPPGFAFYGNWQQGMWSVGHGGAGDYLIGFDHDLGVVGLQFEPNGDADAQLPLQPHLRTAEMYLRYPERSATGRGRRIPDELDGLAQRVVSRKRGPSSGGLWVQETKVGFSGFDTGWFTPYLRVGSGAAEAPYRANQTEQHPWIFDLPVRQVVLDEVLTMLQWPWSEEALVYPAERALRLKDALTGDCYDETRVPAMKRLLRTLGIIWPD